MSDVIKGLTKKQTEGLIERAFQAAKDLGYCEEVSNVLVEMGFELPRLTKTITLEVEVEANYGYDFENDDIDVILNNGYDFDADVHLVRVIGVSE